MRRSIARMLRSSVAPLTLAAAFALTPPAVAQQTTSSITGTVTTSAGTPANDVQVIVTHVPSGTTVTVAVDGDGRFNASGLRVGGPYRVHFDGPSTQPQTLNEVYVQLGEPSDLSVELNPATAVREEIVVTATRRNLVLGTQTAFDQTSIAEAPTITRDLKDVIKHDPKVLIDPTNSNAIQIAGTNPRFNSLTIDGVKANDDFGLNNNGYPTKRVPISMDAIDQLAVVTAPFDVEYDGFEGGTINVVTKSGTNTFHGSAYYYYASDSLTGSRNGALTNLVGPFESKTWGVTLGGPVVQDKLFFFVGYEAFDNTTPATFGTADGGFGNRIPTVSNGDVAQVTSIAKSVYGYNTGGVTTSSAPEKDRKSIAKIDWNIADQHRATFTYQRDEGDTLIDGESSLSAVPNRLSLSSNWYDGAQTLNAYALQIFSDWTPAWSTQFEIGRKTVESTRDPLNGKTIGEVRVLTPGGGQVVFGPDFSSHSNVLSTATDTYKAKTKYLVGAHTVTGGYERETNNYYNLFIQRSLGYWEFPSIAAFAAGKASKFQYNNAYTGQPTDLAAVWDYAENSFYVQDRWDLGPDLALQGGLRYERYENGKKPRLNSAFVTRYGFGNDGTLEGRDLWLPRLGFNYKVLPSTTLRGGVGLYSTLGPAVWISNNYSNDGFTQRSLTITAATNPILKTMTLGVPPAAQVLLAGGDGFVNALDPNFNIPSQWRFDAAIDHRIDNGPTLTGELLYSRVKDAILYRDLRLVRTGTAPDGRPIYSDRADGRTGTSSDLLLTNTHQGDSLVLSVSADQGWQTAVGEFDVNLGYAFTNANDVSPATSSVASSSYGQYTVSDPNNPGLATSNYEARHVLTAAVTWSKKFFDDLTTSLTLFGEARSGLPYSFVFACGSNPFGDPGCGLGQNRELFYVPTGANDPRVDFTAAGSINPAVLDAYINRYGLAAYRGRISPRNAFNSPWVNTVDLHFVQELPSPIEGHKMQFTFDIQNLTNLIDNSWGRVEQVPFFSAVSVVTAKIDPRSGKYVYTGTPGAPNLQLVNRNSVWGMQVGFRYQF